MTTKLLPKRARKHFMMGGLLRFFRERNADIVFGPFPLYYGLTYVLLHVLISESSICFLEYEPPCTASFHDEDE